MGVWDSGSFGNDTALDFVVDLKDFATVRSTLLKFECFSSPLDADDASIALASCDLVATAIGRPPIDIPDNIPNFQDEDVSDKLLKIAKKIVERVRNKSELAELWAEQDDAEWQLALDELLLRLTPSTPYNAPMKKKQVKLPDDFLGHCYVCYGPVTKRDGIYFEHSEENGISSSIHPHRKCIENKISGPHWNDDGSPTEKTKKLLLKDMGYEV